MAVSVFYETQVAHTCGRGNDRDRTVKCGSSMFDFLQRMISVKHGILACGCLAQMHCSDSGWGHPLPLVRQGRLHVPDAPVPRRSGLSLSHCHRVWFPHHHPPLFLCELGVPTDLEFHVAFRSQDLKCSWGQAPNEELPAPS